jgi:excisionase family DNA binding protein
MKNAPSAVEPISVDIATAVKLTSLGRTRIYELIADNTLPSKTIGRRRVIPYAALKALVA